MTVTLSYVAPGHGHAQFPKLAFHASRSGDTDWSSQNSGTLNDNLEANATNTNLVNAATGFVGSLQKK